jgi:hypothetical protein
MNKLTLTAVALLVSFSGSAMAGQVWNITEEAASGIKSAQGTWVLNQTDGKISGTAELQLTNGNTLSYTVDGTVAGSVYTVKLDKRSDGKNGCVWTGNAGEQHADNKSHGLIGEVQCDNAKFKIRAGF